ncbi:MAG TPA: BON domain-containing protein [Bacteriovoracaceae bacterium]|nr:BON domain-containing protein [Bacteriovoracaceae bacterium]
MKMLLTLCLTLSVSAAFGASTGKTEEDVSHKAGTFSQKHSAQKVTADAQMKGTDSDVELTRKIRERLTDDDKLSTSAQNITIVTVGKGLTLKGEVEKQEEIQKVSRIATELAGTKQINNQLTVKKQ